MRVDSSIEVNSTPEKVWQVLADFGSYSSWNPFIISASGEATVGSYIRIVCKPGDSKMTFKPKVLVAEPGAELRWLGRLAGVPGLFSGEHVFTITQLTNARVRLDQHETFYGILVPFVTAKSAVAEIQKAFNDLNAALKARVESN